MSITNRRQGAPISRNANSRHGSNLTRLCRIINIEIINQSQDLRSAIDLSNFGTGWETYQLSIKFPINLWEPSDDRAEYWMTKLHTGCWYDFVIRQPEDTGNTNLVLRIILGYNVIIPAYNCITIIPASNFFLVLLSTEALQFSASFNTCSMDIWFAHVF